MCTFTVGSMVEDTAGFSMPHKTTKVLGILWGLVYTRAAAAYTDAEYYLCHCQRNAMQDRTGFLVCSSSRYDGVHGIRCQSGK